MRVKNIFSNLFFDGFWVVTLDVVTKLSSFVVAFILVRAISKTDYGYYSFVLSVVSVLVIFNLQGAITYVNQSFSRGAHGVYDLALKLRLTHNYIGSGILGLLSLYYLAWEQDYSLGLAILVSGICFPYAFGLTIWLPALQGLRKFKEVSIYQGLQNVAMNVGVIIAAVVVPPSGTVAAMIFAYFLIKAGSNVYLTRLISEKYIENDLVEPGAEKYLTKTSLYVGANTAANYVDRLVIFGVLSEEALAIFAIGNKIPELLKKSVQSVVSILIPRFAKKESLDWRQAGFIYLISLLASLFIVLLAKFTFPILIPLLFTSEYEETVWIAQWLSYTVALTMFSSIPYSFIQSQPNIQNMKTINVFGSVVRIVSSLALIPFLGFLGAIYSAIIYRAILLFFVTSVFIKYIETEKVPID